MRSLRLLLALPLSGCFVAYIPGSMVSALSDGITGQHGQFCVASNTKTGDIIRKPDGTQGTVQSLSGHSTRCKDLMRPVRADIG